MRTVVVIAAVSMTVAAAAQEAPQRLTLEEAVARGLANSQRLAELQARQDAAQASEAARRAAALPILTAQGGYTRTNHVEEFAVAQPGQPPRIIYPDVPDNYRARLDLQWPVYTGGRAGALQRAASAERTAAGADLAAARADLVLEITRAFWAIVTATDTEIVLARALENTGAHVRDLRNRLDQGLIPPNEVLSAEARQSRQRVLAIEAANIRRVAEADMHRLLGLDSFERIVPAASLETAGMPLLEADALVRRAREQRPERAAFEARTAAARNREAAVAALARPQVGITGGYDYARPNPRIFPRIGEWRDSWDLSINVSWTLWDGGRRGADQAEAAAATRAAATRLGEFERQVGFEVLQRRLELESSVESIAAAADGVRAATEARRVVNERFAAGVATSTDVLDAELAVLEAELDRTRALAGARLAEARLARAAGGL